MKIPYAIIELQAKIQMALEAGELELAEQLSLLLDAELMKLLEVAA